MLTDIEQRVLSRVKNKYPTALKTKYPNTEFTNSNRLATTPKFPTVYIHEIGSQEIESDLDGTHINAIRSAIQIDVTDDKSMSNAKEVMNYVVSAMKEMRYTVNTMPEFDNNPSVYRRVARFQRVIGDADVL